MKKYENYEVEDFIQDLYFRQWALDALPPQDTFWKTWQDTHPEQHEKIEEARALVIAYQLEAIPEDSSEIQLAIEAILLDTKKGTFPGFFQHTWFKVAASVAVLMGVFYFGSRSMNWYPLEKAAATNPSARVSDASGLPEKFNQSSVVQEFTLSDGSKVLLDPNSRLRISEEFGQTRREVFLDGDASFDIVKNPQKPFLVYTEKLVTKVLGTSFRVTAKAENQSVYVSVTSGKVTVYKSRANPNPALSEEIILTPNQQAVYVKSDDKLIKTIVENPRQLHKPLTSANFAYNETPISQVFADLEMSYGVRIYYDEVLMKECNLTATLANEPLFIKLALICETIQASYELIDGQIVVNGRGCP
ncbi:FecR family protein [Arundinibacter roseus]|nr:FecR family protein [Arundinibacter roseus]